MSVPLLLFHWSPADRREAIRAEGLRAGAPVTVNEAPAAYVAFAGSPSKAWGLSGALVVAGEWDLWQFWLRSHEPVEIVPGHEGIPEVRVPGDVPPDRLWYVGSRTASPGDDHA